MGIDKLNQMAIVDSYGLMADKIVLVLSRYINDEFPINNTFSLVRLKDMLNSTLEVIEKLDKWIVDSESLKQLEIMVFIKSALKQNGVTITNNDLKEELKPLLEAITEILDQKNISSQSVLVLTPFLKQISDYCTRKHNELLHS